MTPGDVEDPLIIIVGEVPYERLKTAYAQVIDDKQEVVLVDLSKAASEDKVSWQLDVSGHRVYYLNQKIESAPAFFHHLDKIEGGRLLEARVQHVYLARYPKRKRHDDGVVCVKSDTANEKYEIVHL
jgi:hypothetical protein